MADVDLGPIIKARQEIEARRRSAADFQKKVKDRRGIETTIWNPAVGGEAAFKQQNTDVDKALGAFDKGPLGSLLTTGAGKSTLSLEAGKTNQTYLNGPTHDWYQKYGTEPAALVPGVVSTMFNRFADSPKPGATVTRILAPYLAEGAGSGLLGYLAKNRADKQQETNPKDADVARLWGNVGEGWVLDLYLGGHLRLRKALRPPVATAATVKAAIFLRTALCHPSALNSR
jgi:hypothetical protein